MLWQTHRGKRVLGPGAIVTAADTIENGGDAVVVRRLCRKTRTYQVADRLGGLQSIPFLWVVPKRNNVRYVKVSSMSATPGRRPPRAR